MRVHGTRRETTTAEASAATTKAAPAMPSEADAPRAAPPPGSRRSASRAAGRRPRPGRRQAAATGGGRAAIRPPSRRNETVVLAAGSERRCREDAEDAPGQPGAGEGEERRASGRGSVEAREQREREDRHQVVGAHQHVRDPVVDGTEAGGHQVRVAGPAQQGGGRAGDDSGTRACAAHASRQGPPQERDPGQGHDALPPRAARPVPPASGGRRRSRCRRRGAARSRPRSRCCRPGRSGPPAARCRARGRGRRRRTRPAAAGDRQRRARLARRPSRPSSSAESAIPISTPGSGTPIRPRKPPNAITIGKVTGSSHIAGGPSWAPHSPTATMART